jgi:hypothetical protein
MFFSRGLNKHQHPYTIPNMYKEYIAEYKDNELYAIDYKLFVKLTEEYYKQLMYEVLVNGILFKLPYRLGYLRVVKQKIHYDHKIAIDWGTTNKVGKRVYHLNDHTRGYKYLFRWTKTNVLTKYAKLYRLVMTRDHKRHLAKLIKGGQDYFELY